MTTSRTDFDRIAAAWMAEGPRVLADRVLDAALGEVHLTSQRRRNLAPWRPLTMNKPVALAAGIAIAVGAFYLTTVNRGPNQPSAGQEPEATPAVVTPSPASPAVTSPPGLTGLIAYSRVAGGVATIVRAKPDGSDMATLISGPANNVQPAWSPDGAKLAWATTNGLQIAAANGSGGERLTTDGRDRLPAWSPDGSAIVFASSRDGKLDIYTQQVAGDTVVRLTSNDVDDDHPSWSTTTNLIAFASARAGTRDIWTMNPDGSDLAQLTSGEGEDDDPAWSPDGTKIAFVSDREDGTSYVYVMDADGSGAERLSVGASEEHDPAWSPDGGYVAFSRSDGNADIVIVDVTTREVVSTLTKERTESNYPAWRNP